MYCLFRMNIFQIIIICVSNDTLLKNVTKRFLLSKNERPTPNIDKVRAIDTFCKRPQHCHCDTNVQNADLKFDIFYVSQRKFLVLPILNWFVEFLRSRLKTCLELEKFKTHPVKNQQRKQSKIYSQIQNFRYWHGVFPMKPPKNQNMIML